jgi:hypothetical protein
MIEVSSAHGACPALSINTYFSCALAEIYYSRPQAVKPTLRKLSYYRSLLIVCHFIMLTMEHRIYFSVCGEGYGHSSRAISIASKLESKGAHILMGSYGYALERLKIFYPAVNIKKEFEMMAKEGAFDLKATLLQSKNSALNYSLTLRKDKELFDVIG